jgi:DNA-binding HxlR family transcriptional regulator
MPPESRSVKSKSAEPKTSEIKAAANAKSGKKMKNGEIKNAPCPVEVTIEIIGGKWKSIILYYLLKQPIMRFSDLQKVMSGVTHQMLAKQLRELETEGLLHRKVYPQVPPKVEYSLTEFGLTLEPIILAMKDWGMLYNSRNRK